ncbi:MAG: dihydroorotate dehydrogenase electron transfer subunit [Actinomycetales bacterium]|nr:dihydroorotate dehydrogenase electron transfer subunit [Actinomycetales bacterium]
MSNAQQITSTITSMNRVGAYWHVVLRAPEVAHAVQPGHFVAVAVGAENSSMLLRRAFSIHRAIPGESIEIIFAEHGAGTKWLATQQVGATLDIIAPLGTPFVLPKAAVACVLVAGGYGSAPMGMLAKALKERGCHVEVVLGAATGAKLFGVLDLKRDADNVTVTTDDGSSGVRGRVTDVLAEIIGKSGATAVYACGPMPMLKAVAELSAEHSVFSQCAVEEAMACGIGVCMTCVLPVVGDDGQTRMVRSCVEGPVFRGDRVRWDDVHTIPADAIGAPVPGGH